eukprot:14686401-Alexandrium_andersonii.AAC.1
MEGNDGSEATRRSFDGQARALALGEVEEARGEVPRGLIGGSVPMECLSRGSSALALGSVTVG